jgi:hypothetical protein
MGTDRLGFTANFRRHGGTGILPPINSILALNHRIGYNTTAH